MKYSICIPNYNYADYLTLAVCSALDQDHADLEICIADNASTDGSVAAVQALDDPRVKVRINRCNVGFAANLDRAAGLATGDRMILLSSDDLMHRDALSCYQALADAMGPAADRAIFNSTVDIIDSAGTKTGHEPLNAKLMASARRDDALSQVAGATVWRAEAGRLLADSLAMLRTPLKFLTTCYPRALYEEVEGYGGGRLMNPDKLFSWKLLSVASEVVFVDRPLFSYRVHAANQNAIQAKQGALKHLSDQYLSTFDLPETVFARSGVTREALAAAFVEQDIGLRGLHLLATGRREEARRGLDFGRATYPALTRGNRKVLALRALLAAGPIGTFAARRLHAGAVRKWADGQGLQA